MKIVVTGGSGMLGTDIVKRFTGKHEVIGLSFKDMDITGEEATRSRIREIRPDILIHTAAFTQVDACESDRDGAFRVNEAGTRHVALAALDVGARLVAISTDYVYDGKKRSPYVEGDPTSPLGVYGLSKLKGEKQIEDLLENFLIIRTSWLFGHHGANFVKTILRIAGEQKTLRVVDDQRGSPTYTPDLADAIFRLLQTPARGIVHVSNSGTCTWWDYAVKIIQLSGREGISVLPISTAEAGRPAPRPANSVLDNGRYQALTGHTLRPWEEALTDYMKFVSFQ